MLTRSIKWKGLRVAFVAEGVLKFTESANQTFDREMMDLVKAHANEE